MARKRFKGDKTHRLPQGQIEPYRLWFYSLQLAHKAGLKINKGAYKGWGDFEGAKFDTWWDSHWQDLFGTSIGVREIEDIEDFNASNDKNSLIIRVPLDQPLSKSIEELRSVHAALPDRLKSDKPKKGRFQLTNSVRIRTSDVRRYLRSYDFRLDGLSIKEVALKYCEWADEWDKVRGKRQPVTHPSSLMTLMRMVESGETITGNTSEYRTVQRMCRRGRQIVENAASGVFPGEYK